MKKILFVLVLIALSNVINASAYNGKIMSFKQPDGTSVEVKLYGNEYYMRAEGLDGYTVVRDIKTKWICYANLSEDNNELISTGIVYQGVQNTISSLKTNLPFVKHLDVSTEAQKVVIKKNKSLLGATKMDASTNKLIDNGVDQSIAGTPIHTVSGNIKGLCIVIDFSDEPGTLPMSEFVDFCNDMNYSNFGNNGSLRTFYSDISGGIVDYENVVYGYYRAPLTFADYDAMPYAVGAQQILGGALNWIDAQGFDFSTLSINPDGSIMAINMMYTGYPPTWAQGMWFHKGNYTGFAADGVFSDDYNCSPANDPLELAVVAHENGHMIGQWPDTYKYDSNHGNDGLGTFDLMCYYGDPLNPVPPNPLFRSNVGWGRVEDVTFYNGVNIDTANSMTCFKYRNLNDTNEFFLLESRMQNGRSSAIDDQGLTIWHIDRNGDNQSFHHEVYLVHAGNDNSTPHFNACFEQSFNVEYSAATIPSSEFYNGDPSGLRVWDIGPVGNIMNYKLGIGSAGPSLNLMYTSMTGDDNANGFVEAAESANIQLDALNYGQVNSSNATVTCTAVGVNASYVTVNTAPMNVGVINVSQTIPTSFNFSVAPGTPLGTVISLKFEISDGAVSNYITRNILVGVVIPMNNNTSVTTCLALFYDQGIENSYSDNTDFTKTFLPVNSGDKVSLNFTEFELEDFTNCGYDYLKIYNGPNAASPLIGTYCGVNSPGQVTSTHATGSLTFKFHADEGVTAAGWKAIVSCINGVSLNENLHSTDLQVFPNPSAGVVTLQFVSDVNAMVSVYDVTGREVFTHISKGQKELKLDLSDRTNGIYLLKIKIGQETVIRKVILNK
ncbi:MAG: M6 family metalloprotease domain-containing protein [Bacteroidota bacterium]|nr:M6 family metalloprotease domain-containing protein [Bacteroidota bacterium]